MQEFGGSVAVDGGLTLFQAVHLEGRRVGRISIQRSGVVARASCGFNPPAGKSWEVCLRVRVLGDGTVGAGRIGIGGRRGEHHLQSLSRMSSSAN
jgi:hypothetical protein